MNYWYNNNTTTIITIIITIVIQIIRITIIRANNNVWVAKEIFIAIVILVFLYSQVTGVLFRNKKIHLKRVLRDYLFLKDTDYREHWVTNYTVYLMHSAWMHSKSTVIPYNEVQSSYVVTCLLWLSSILNHDIDLWLAVHAFIVS